MRTRCPLQTRSLLNSLTLSLSMVAFCFAQSPAPSPSPTPKLHPIAIAKDRSEVSEAEITKILLEHQQWIASKGKEGKAADLNGASLMNWDLSGMRLNKVHLDGASLVSLDAHRARFDGAHLERSKMFTCNFTDAIFAEANLSGVTSLSCDFTRASMLSAVLRGTMFFHAKLKDAILSDADLTDAIYQPESEQIPSISSLATAKGLSRLRFNESELGLVELRNALQKAGLREQERQVNYSLQRQRWEHWKKSGEVIEPWFNYIFFDLTCRYGMVPGLALQILTVGIFVFALPYFVAIVFRKRWKQSGIWAVRDKEAVLNPERKTRALPVAIEPWAAPTWWGKARSFFRAVRVAFFFSLLSAFSIGFREINVRSWIARLQPREYTLRGTGWVRCIAGFQSLLSVYLLALWVLTYFGRPFE